MLLLLKDEDIRMGGSGFAYLIILIYEKIGSLALMLIIL